jgi:hypothetical protein
MSNIIKTLKRNVKRVYKPVQKLLGITDTTITNITNSKSTPNFIKKPLQAVQSYGHTVIEGRNDYQPKARAIIKQYGDKPIKAMKIIRQPIQSFINTAFNALTFGQFQKKLDELPYDKLFHLRMVVTMEDNKQIQIEKNEVINLTLKIDTVKGQEEMNVNIMSPITLNQLLDGGKTILKDRYFSYRAFGNNCQDYQLALLKGSNLLTPQLENFIKQDVSELANINPYLKKIANAFTDLGGKFNEIIHGTGIHKKHSKSHKDQSVVFDKKHWTVKEAKKWLLENNYTASKVDRKLNTLRFRQIDPEQFNRDEWKYTTHRLPDNIELVIVYKNPKQSKGTGINDNINMHTIRAKGGELIHIDLNSHNSSGKSKNEMSGDGIKETSLKRTPVTGGVLDLDVPQPLPFMRPSQTMTQKQETNPTFKPQGKIFKSKNALLNNLTTDDIRDLKKLFSEIGEEEIKKKETTAKIRKATVKRIKTDAKKPKKSPLAKIRGTIEGKRQALKKYKKKST